MSTLVRKGKRDEEEGGVLEVGLGLVLKIDTYIADFSLGERSGKSVCFVIH